MQVGHPKIQVVSFSTNNPHFLQVASFLSCFLHSLNNTFKNEKEKKIKNKNQLPRASPILLKAFLIFYSLPEPPTIVTKRINLKNVSNLSRVNILAYIRSKYPLNIILGITSNSTIKVQYVKIKYILNMCHHCLYIPGINPYFSLILLCLP